MDVLKYNKKIFEINSICDLNSYIKKYLYVTDFIETPTHLIHRVNEILRLNPNFIYKSHFNKELISIFSNGGKLTSKYQYDYWLNRGHNESNIKNIISNLQKKNSPRCLEYWTDRGFDITTAKNKIRNIQIKNGNGNKNKPIEELRRLSHRCSEYWIAKGYSKNEAIEIIKQKSASYHINYWKTATEEQKNRQIHKGSKNGMYGKPSPTGSGNGWSGWYNGWYFRSLRELTYMIKVIDRFNLDWISGESNKFLIKYKNHKETIRTYRPDFIINGKYMVEIKPKALHKSKEVISKANAAIKFCNKNGMIYKLKDIGCLSQDEIIQLYESGNIKWLPRYEEKYKNYILK